MKPTLSILLFFALFLAGLVVTGWWIAGRAPDAAGLSRDLVSALVATAIYAALTRLSGARRDQAKP
jgi:hypothetical protein